MRAVLTSFGTTGDVFPLCVLAHELRRRGHAPNLVVPRHCAKLAAQLQLDCQVYGPDVSELLVEILSLQNAGPAGYERYKQLVARLSQATPRAFSDLSVACRGADVLICSLDPPLGLTIHETTRIPYVALHLTCPYDDRWYRQDKLRGVNALRVLLRLAPFSSGGVIDPTGISPQLTLFALSRHLFPPQSDWPEHFHVTGFFFPEERAWEPAPQLAAFVADGEPPVIVTFGSMLYDEPRAVNALLLAALERVGCRAILQMGDPQTFEGLRVPPQVKPIGFASHTWLFAHADCAVHHGSPGTAAAVFRAGIPAVIVPHAFDQFEVANYAHAQGCAGPPLPFRELTVENLSNAVAALRSDARHYQAARTLREQLLHEDGAGTAATLIEQLLERLRRTPPARAHAGERL